jgi:hypothetical protein
VTLLNIEPEGVVVAKVYSSILSFFPPTEAKIYQRKILLHGLPNNGVLRLDARWVTVRRAW